MNDATASAIATPAANTCSACGAIFPSGVLACPTCRRLVHTERLKELSALAAGHAAASDREAELTTWRSALELLPLGSRQHGQIGAKIAALVAAGSEPGAKAPAKGAAMGKLAALGGLGLLLWKFKWLLVFVLTKGKLLLLGLTKMSTLLSMLLSLGLYWSLWGWKLALGFVLSIYVHEMGHVAAFRKLGIAATAPMFIPGLGAFIRGKQYPSSPVENAQVGLAGPIWGLGAALGCYGISLVWDAPFFAALARIGGWLNLFNLIPVMGLDGSHGFGALSRKERWWAAAVIGGAWFLTEENLLLLLLIAAVVRAFGGNAPANAHRPTLITYAVLVGALSWLSSIEVAVESGPPATPRAPAATGTVVAQGDR